jgi:CBS domain containing-hemolysin-like protein
LAGFIKHIRKKDLIAGLMVAFFTFFIASLINLGSELLIRMMNNVYLALLMLLVIILSGIFFDIIGTAATAADLSPFNARAAKKVFGANQAVKIISNASVVANYCNDVIGDIAGTLSGAIGAFVVVKLMESFPFVNAALIGAFMTSFIAALTVGGKAIGKGLALARANQIIFSVAIFVAWFENLTKIELFKKKVSK